MQGYVSSLHSVGQRQDCYCLTVDTNGVLTYTVYTNSPGGGRAVASVSWISGKEKKNTAS